MTLMEIKQQLDKEFPDRTVSFTMEVNTYRGNPNFTEPDDPQGIEVSIYDSEFKTIPCVSLEEGIRALKSRIGTLTPEIEIDIAA